MENLNVLYEDNHIIAVEKPYGVPSQEDMSNDEDMLSIIKQYLKEKYKKPGNVYVGLVHRLDRVTGGVMVFAKTSKAASRLSEEIRTNRFEKAYLCVVEGHLKDKEGRWEDHLYKDSKLNLVSTCSPSKKNAKYCLLEYRVLEEKEGYSLVKVKLHTGRSHQIRVQFSSRGFPLLGDKKYGSSINLDHRIALWSYQIQVKHPTKDEVLSFCLPANVFPFSMFQTQE